MCCCCRESNVKKVPTLQTIIDSDRIDNNDEQTKLENPNNKHNSSWLSSSFSPPSAPFGTSETTSALSTTTSTSCHHCSDIIACYPSSETGNRSTATTVGGGTGNRSTATTVGTGVAIEDMNHQICQTEDYGVTLLGVVGAKRMDEQTDDQQQLDAADNNKHPNEFKQQHEGRDVINNNPNEQQQHPSTSSVGIIADTPQTAVEQSEKCLLTSENVSCCSDHDDLMFGSSSRPVAAVADLTHEGTTDNYSSNDISSSRTPAVGSSTTYSSSSDATSSSTTTISTTNTASSGTTSSTSPSSTTASSGSTTTASSGGTSSSSGGTSSSSGGTTSGGTSSSSRGDEVTNELTAQRKQIRGVHGRYSIEKKKLHEDDNSASWLKHKRHVLIFTYSGKPVFSRYGSEDRLSALSGTLSAIASKMASLFSFSNAQDSLRSVHAGGCLMVFLQRGPLWLVSISREPSVSYRQLHALLDRTHLQVMCVLTRGIEKTLLARPGYDVRHLLGGTDSVVCNFISWYSQDMLALVDGFEPLPLNSTMRHLTSNLLRDVKASNVLAVLLVAGHRIVSMVESKLVSLQPADIVALINLVLSSASLRQSESWIPICLPCISDKAFMYAYVSFLSSDVCMICLSAVSDGEQFYKLSQHFKHCSNMLTNIGVMAAVHKSLLYCPYKLPPRDWGTLDLVHLCYFLPISKQYFSSAFHDDCRYKHKRRRVFRLYHMCTDLLKSSQPPCHVYIEAKHEKVYVWQTPDFVLYVAVTRCTDVNTNLITQLVQWVKDNSCFLFITAIPTMQAA
eukprot:GHVS01007075.1.p1 GENE.GHVS01007075.1~~GHVS01007075.1.p1  ORF type:complete len:790 (+),score=186.16 GHVS01007075.1:124-2493(+)